MPEDLVTDLERDLAVLLRVEPSPEFAAGVRQRIAGRPKAAGRAVWAFAAAAALTLLAAGWALRSEHVDPSLPLLMSSRAAEPSPTARESARPGSGAASPAVRTRPPRAAQVRRDVEPEIVIDPAFGSAVRRLLRSAQRQPRIAAALEADAGADGLPPYLSVVPVPVDELTIPIIRIGEPRDDVWHR